LEASGGMVVHHERHWVTTVGVLLFSRGVHLFSGK
jgi:hypothetical protein